MRHAKVYSSQYKKLPFWKEFVFLWIQWMVNLTLLLAILFIEDIPIKVKNNLFLKVTFLAKRTITLYTIKYLCDCLQWVLYTNLMYKINSFSISNIRGNPYKIPSVQSGYEDNDNRFLSAVKMWGVTKDLYKICNINCLLHGILSTLTSTPSI